MQYTCLCLTAACAAIQAMTRLAMTSTAMTSMVSFTPNASLTAGCTAAHTLQRSIQQCKHGNHQIQDTPPYLSLACLLCWLHYGCPTSADAQYRWLLLTCACTLLVCLQAPTRMAMRRTTATTSTAMTSTATPRTATTSMATPRTVTPRTAMTSMATARTATPRRATTARATTRTVSNRGMPALAKCSVESTLLIMHSTPL